MSEPAAAQVCGKIRDPVRSIPKRVSGDRVGPQTPYTHVSRPRFNFRCLRIEHLFLEFEVMHIQTLPLDSYGECVEFSGGDQQICHISAMPISTPVGSG